MSSEGADLLRDLARPTAYPAPAPANVTVHTTHASWVFLTETEAWKVKRPVDFGFLDYSDADRRQRCCEEEVRLGSRLAPDVYRGVVPVYLGPAGHAFVPPGPVVDHAVRMRRLPEEQSALALLRAERLGADLLARLAAQLAAFYDETPECRPLGAPEVLLANIRENHEQTRPHAGRFIEADELEVLYRWQQGVVCAERGRLLGRASDGRIRDGHGDLRLEHVYFPPALGGDALVIDPIEFNRSFRCQDVALDVAFLAMELQAAQREDLASWFLSCFAAESNDYGFYPVLDLYLSYRAWVRAKVACFVAADPATAPAKARRKGHEAERLFALAASYRTHSRHAGPLIVVGGMIASGKTTLAEALGRALALPVISSDRTRKGIAGLRTTDRGGADLYTDAFTRRTYAALMEHARAVLDSNRGAILDATFRDPESRALARALAREHRRRLLFVEMTVDESVARERLRRRAGAPGVSDAREELLESMRDSYSPPVELPAGDCLRVDGALCPEEMLRRVKAALDR